MGTPQIILIVLAALFWPVRVNPGATITSVRGFLQWWLRWACCTGAVSSDNKLLNCKVVDLYPVSEDNRGIATKE